MRAHQQGAVQRVDDAMDVVEGQRVQDGVLGAPLPGCAERVHLCSKAPACTRVMLHLNTPTLRRNELSTLTSGASCGATWMPSKKGQGIAVPSCLSAVPRDRSPVAVQDAFGLASGATRVDDQGALLWVVQCLLCAQASGTWGWLLSCCICWARRVLVMLGVLQHSWWAQHVHS